MSLAGSVSTPQRRAARPSAFLGIQVLRGLAAAMVVVYHATQMWSSHVGTGTQPAPWWNGAAGVDIFFIISGFVMAVSTFGRERKDHPARYFLGRRLVRLIPLYWLMTSVEFLKSWAVRNHPQLANSTSLVATPLSYVLASLFFIPYRNSAGEIHPLLSVGWSLSFEMLFYLLFALALALRADVVRVLAPLFVALGVLGLFHTDAWPSIAVLVSPYLFEFLAGLLLGRAVLRGWTFPAPLAAGLGLAAMVTLLVLPGELGRLTFPVWSVCAYLLVQAAVLLDRPMAAWWPRWALLIGDASYSLYLVHLLVFAPVVKLLSRLHLLTPGATQRSHEFASAAIALSLSVGIAVLLFLYIEKPMTLWLRRHVLGEYRTPVL